MATRQRRSAAPGTGRLDRAAFEAEFPGTSGSATECTVLLVRAAEGFLALANRALARHDLSATGREVLAVLEGAGQPLPAGEVAARVLVTTASMTAVLDTLERRRLLRRLPDPADRRRVLIDITDDGRALVDAFLPEMAALQAAVCEPLGEAERDLLVDLLGVLDEQARAIDPEAIARAAPHRIPRR
jgi:MarR family transcriptional regulator, 2-MHQ and catechol-resistance regulon repressor